MIITIIHKLQIKKSERVDNLATKFDFSVDFLIQYIVLIILELLDFFSIFTFMAPLASVSEKTPLLLCLLFFLLWVLQPCKQTPVVVLAKYSLNAPWMTPSADALLRFIDVLNK